MPSGRLRSSQGAQGNSASYSGAKLLTVSRSPSPARRSPACIFYSHVPTASDDSDAALYAFSCTVLKCYSFFIFFFPFSLMEKDLGEVCRVLVFKAAGSNCRTASIRRHGPVEAKIETAKFSVLLGVVPGARGGERSPAALALPCDICTHERARIHRSQITPLITPKCLSRHFR